jgi:uncharacterized SAM-binding protein YcdF (DUF218 family)
MTHSTNHPERRLLGLARRKCLWLPTWRGWLVLLTIGSLTGYGALRGVHPFLAVDAPVAARVMVVEGWIPMPALQAAAERFRAEGYETLCTVGGPIPGEPCDSSRNDAVIVADQFLEMGIPAEKVHAVPSGAPERDRTYTSAAVLRGWFEQQGGLPVRINVVTQGAHSRRSRLLFQAAFGGEVEVGVISVPDPDYDATTWWNYSEGVKEVLSEGAAYLYARFLFHPG